MFSVQQTLQVSEHYFKQPLEALKLSDILWSESFALLMGDIPTTVVLDLLMGVDGLGVWLPL